MDWKTIRRILNNTFTAVGQIYSNYCVPASVRAALGYINAGLTSVPSQSTIAQNLGTGAPNTTVGIADPWPLYAGSGSSFYTISSNGVFGSL